jgi:hypothetical protein
MERQHENAGVIGQALLTFAISLVMDRTSRAFWIAAQDGHNLAAIRNIVLEPVR